MVHIAIQYTLEFLECPIMPNPIQDNYLATLTQSELGKQSTYDSNYNPNRLCALPRAQKRLEIGIDPNHLPFFGFDCWNHYEVSWLNEKGKPMVSIAEIIFDCSSPKFIESKSLKLYFNSFNNTKIKNHTELEKRVKQDLQERIGAEVHVVIHDLTHAKRNETWQSFEGESIDALDITCSIYTVDPSFLSVEDIEVEETLHSDLLKSNCLITKQPDWASIKIAYKGKKINREGLLQYIVSYRNHNDFHEQCIERIFVDIMKYCKPQKLTVYGRYTRRGGKDINPYRSTEKCAFDGKNIRLIRQ